MLKLAQPVYRAYRLAADGQATVDDLKAAGCTHRVILGPVWDHELDSTTALYEGKVVFIHPRDVQRVDDLLSSSWPAAVHSQAHSIGMEPHYAMSLLLYNALASLYGDTIKRAKEALNHA